MRIEEYRERFQPYFDGHAYVEFHTAFEVVPPNAAVYADMIEEELKELVEDPYPGFGYRRDGLHFYVDAVAIKEDGHLDYLDRARYSLIPLEGVKPIAYQVLGDEHLQEE